jgi:hypothetical protein
MPRKKYIEPKTQMEAMKIIIQVWTWLITRNPAIFIPFTGWMLFGGFYFAYKTWVAPTFDIQEAKPLSENVSFSIIPQAFAGGEPGVPIKYNGQLWGYADTTFVATVRADAPGIIVYDKKNKKVYSVDFNSQEDFRKQMRK